MSLCVSLHNSKHTRFRLALGCTQPWSTLLRPSAGRTTQERPPCMHGRTWPSSAGSGIGPDRRSLKVEFEDNGCQKYRLCVSLCSGVCRRHFKLVQTHRPWKRKAAGSMEYNIVDAASFRVLHVSLPRHHRVSFMALVLCRACP